MSQEIGYAAEDQARRYLIAQGLIWLKSNYRCRLGEIDLIMRDDHYLVFIEVRARHSNQYGGPLASITRNKQQKLIKTAYFYLQAFHGVDTPPCRFDVIAMEGSKSAITWIKNAFELW